MILYVTYNDPPSGIYSSQVIDVCNLIRRDFVVPTRLIAFVSIRGFFGNRKKIKNEDPTAIVIPSVPKINNWRMNRLLLLLICWVYKPDAIIARGIFAANISLYARNANLVDNVCYDGRGAAHAEFDEYDLVDQTLIAQVFFLEKNAILESDYRIAVSQKLVDHWTEKYGYTSPNHVVIPCTLGSNFIEDEINDNDIVKGRKEMGFDKDDIILVYSGSNAGWQSFELMKKFLVGQLRQNGKIKVLFLSKETQTIRELVHTYPGQVKVKWVDQSAVSRLLGACDHGLLIREKSVTNQVAAPTKFAEYLNSGLNVLISENIGDYSEFVRNHECGHVICGGATDNLTLYGIDSATRNRNMEIAHTFFSKRSELLSNNYSALIRNLVGTKKKNT